MSDLLSLQSTGSYTKFRPASLAVESESETLAQQWHERLQSGASKYEALAVSDYHTPSAKVDGAIRVVIISDTHGRHDQLTPILPDGDVLLHAGDFSRRGHMDEIKSFNAWLKQLDGKFKHKIVIAGNHELTLDDDLPAHNLRIHQVHVNGPVDNAAHRAALSDCVYLENTSVVVEGIKIYGSPHTPWYGDWAFNIPRGDACKAMWATIPTDADIVMTHGPPLGHGDCVHQTDERFGCLDLLEWVETNATKYHVFGHIHEGYGVSTNGRTTFINASSLKDKEANEMNRPIVIDVVPSRK